MLDRGEDEDWFGSPFIRVMAALAAFGIVGGIIWLKTAKHPIVNLDVFKDRNFTMGCVCISAVGGVLYAGAVVIPQFAQNGDRLYGDMGRPDPVAGGPRHHRPHSDRRRADVVSFRPASIIAAGFSSWAWRSSVFEPPFADDRFHAR